MGHRRYARAEVAAVYFGFGFGFGFGFWLPSLRFFVYLASSCRLALSLFLVCKESTKKATATTTTIEKSRLTTVTATWSRPKQNASVERSKKGRTCNMRPRPRLRRLRHVAGHRNKAWLLAEKQSRLSASLYLTLCANAGCAGEGCERETT